MQLVEFWNTTFLKNTVICQFWTSYLIPSWPKCSQNCPAYASQTLHSIISHWQHCFRYISIQVYFVLQVEQFKVFVAGLPGGTEDSDLAEAMEKYGQVAFRRWLLQTLIILPPNNYNLQQEVQEVKNPVWLTQLLWKSGLPDPVTLKAEFLVKA